ncbi:Bromo adjacent-like proteiny domain-containing 1 protein [Aphelenchoides fujianensis]|nr:Bromo adjacent-like proteiny domain-containing 1 protein [Aphelenchoides fujianensis]
MAPVGHLGGGGANVATFHGLPNTSGLAPLPAGAQLFEMPKLSAQLPLMPPTPTMNSFPTYPAEIPHQPAAAAIPASPFHPQNLLMSCNFSFLNPQALALYFQLQQHQQQHHQQQHQQAPPQPTPPTPMAPLNPFAHLMPMFAPNSLLGASPQSMFAPASSSAMLPPAQLPKRPQQTPPTTAFFHPPPPPAFNFAPALSVAQPKATPTFTLVNNPAAAPVVQLPPTLHPQQPPPQLQQQVRRFPENETQLLHHRLSALPPTLEPNRPPSLRPESPTDPLLPPHLEPELPCFSADFDDLSGPPDLTPAAATFAFGDEPPVLEPEAEIRGGLDAASFQRCAHVSPLPLPLPLPSASLTPTTSTACSSTTSPTEVAPPAALQIHPLIRFMATHRLESPAAKFVLAATPAVASVAPQTPPTPALSASVAPRPPSRLSLKRERSASVDSNSDVMLKMPKLLPMTADYSDASGGELSPLQRVDDEAEHEMPRGVKEEADEQPMELEDATVAPLLFEVPAASPLEQSRAPSPAAEAKPTESGGQPPLTPVPALLIADTADSRPTADCSALSSSGVSSANSTLLAEEAAASAAALEPIGATRTEAAAELVLVEEATLSLSGRSRTRTRSESTASASTRSTTPDDDDEDEAMRDAASKLRPRASRAAPAAPATTKKPRKSTQQKRAARGRGGARRKGARVRSVSIKSNWRPVDEGKLQDVRFAGESQFQRRRCYDAIRHQREYDEVIRARDCVRVRSSEGLENVGKIVRLFLDDSSGHICAEVLWYYAPAQVNDEVARGMHEKELLASKHCDIINVDAIEEHAFVLSFSEYCRFVAETRLDEMPPERRPLESREVWPRGEENYSRRPRLPHEDTPIDLVYFCRNVYSLRTRKLIVSAPSRRGSKSSTNGRRNVRAHR